MYIRLHFEDHALSRSKSKSPIAGVICSKKIVHLVRNVLYRFILIMLKTTECVDKLVQVPDLKSHKNLMKLAHVKLLHFLKYQETQSSIIVALFWCGINCKIFLGSN